MERMILSMNFTIFAKYKYSHDVNVDTRIFLLFFKGISRTYVLKSTLVLFFYYKFYNNNWKKKLLFARM